jgi:two-component system sensor histidine kinase RegB
MFGLPRIQHRPKNVRLETLVRLRWLAVLGQFAAVLVVHFGLEFDVPLWSSLAVIALAALLNIALRVGFPHTQWLEPDRAAYLLGFDIAELAALLYLTGGLENPFSFLLLGPVLISATALPRRMTMLLGVFAVLCATVLIFFHYPLPWESGEQLQLPETYVVAVWLSILLAIGYIGVYTWQVAEEARQLSDALAATELVLAREQHLSQLDGLAAAAAHELGTPLATITLVVREMERALDPQSPYADDVKLLREQAQRCRDILSKIAELPAGEPFDRVPLPALIEEAVAPHRHFDVSIEVKLPSDQPDMPVEILAQWTATEVRLTISDDGPGFAPEILDRIGAPYVTHRRTGPRPTGADEDEYEGGFGLGLGFFIAKTLLERSGATLSLKNQMPPLHGATVTIVWNRADFERVAVAPPLEPATVVS